MVVVSVCGLMASIYGVLTVDVLVWIQPERVIDILRCLGDGVM